jgi:hypothetical protein
MFCSSGLLSKTGIFILHPSSYKKFDQFCTVSRIACIELIVNRSNYQKLKTKLQLSLFQIRNKHNHSTERSNSYFQLCLQTYSKNICIKKVWFLKIFIIFENSNFSLFFGRLITGRPSNTFIQFT